jgi:hypothetical protein
MTHVQSPLCLIVAKGERLLEHFLNERQFAQMMDIAPG